MLADYFGSLKRNARFQKTHGMEVDHITAWAEHAKESTTPVKLTPRTDARTTWTVYDHNDPLVFGQSASHEALPSV